MKPLHDEAKPEIRKAHHWIPISISVLALIVAGLTYWQSRKQGQESKRQWEESKKQWEESRHDVRTLATPLVSVLVNTNTTDPEFGLQISNDGATAVKISDITYYVDRKSMDSVKDMVNDDDDLVDVNWTEIGDDTVLAVGEKDWLLSKKPKDKQKDIDYFLKFVDGRVAVEVTACSILTGECQTKCSHDGWCK